VRRTIVRASSQSLRAAVAHDVGDFRLASEERLERLLVGPFVDDENLAIAARECVPDGACRLPGLRDSLHHLTAWPGGVTFQIGGVAGYPQNCDDGHVRLLK